MRAPDLVRRAKLLEVKIVMARSSISTVLAVLVHTAVALAGDPPPLTLDRAALFRELMKQEVAEGSTADHLSFLDRGLASSPFAGELASLAERLGAAPIGEDAPIHGEAMPARGLVPAKIATSAFEGFDGALKGACVVVARFAAGGWRYSWYGRDALGNSQFWSSTKVLQALNLVSLANEKRPSLSIDAMVLRPADGSTSEPTVPFSRLMREIVSYEAGVARSNAGAETLGRFLRRGERENLIEEHTGHDVTFRGAYGAGALIARPRLQSGAEVVATAPADPGETGPNLVSAYDLTRMLALAAWHRHLSPAQRIFAAQWHSLSPVLTALGHDSARYIDVAIQKLGLRGKIGDVVIATKLGMGTSSATGLAQICYAGVFQFVDRRVWPPLTRRACFALKAEHRDAVTLDARMAVEVTDLVRRLANGDL